MRIQVKDFMSTSITTVSGETSVAEARSIMNEKGIHAIPVIAQTHENAEKTIRGIITTSDINKNIPEHTKVEDVIKPSLVHVVHVDSNAKSAAKMMLKHHVHHLVVMDEGKIKGMISSLDFVKLVADHSLE